MARNSSGETISITALIKTQGSDTKLVGQMQPCYEALGCNATTLAGREIPPLVSQIADGENGGVMMNEFPPLPARPTNGSRDEQRAPWPSTARNTSSCLRPRVSSRRRIPAIQAVQQQRLWNAIGDNPQPPDRGGARSRPAATAGDGFLDGGEPPGPATSAGWLGTRTCWSR